MERDDEKEVRHDTCIFKIVHSSTFSTTTNVRDNLIYLIKCNELNRYYFDSLVKTRKY